MLRLGAELELLKNLHVGRWSGFNNCTLKVRGMVNKYYWSIFWLSYSAWFKAIFKALGQDANFICLKFQKDQNDSNIIQYHLHHTECVKHIFYSVHSLFLSFRIGFLSTNLRH